MEESFSKGKIITVVDIAILQVSQVGFLDFYLSKVPPEVKPTDQCYLQPQLLTPRPWYWTSPLGMNRLQQMVKQMFRDANIEQITALGQLVQHRSLMQEFQSHYFENRRGTSPFNLFVLTANQKRTVSNIICLWLTWPMCILHQRWASLTSLWLNYILNIRRDIIIIYFYYYYFCKGILPIVLGC